MLKGIREAKSLQMEQLHTPYQRGKITIKKSDIWQFLRFCVVGSLNAVIDFLVLNLLLLSYPSQDIWRVLSYNSLAVLLAATNSFFCNKYWTFQQRRSIAWKEVYRFVVVAGGTIVLNDGLMWQFSRLFPNLMGSSLVGANALKLAAIIGTMSISFFGMRLWVFFQSAVTIDTKSSKRMVHEVSLEGATLGTSGIIYQVRLEERMPLETFINNGINNQVVRQPTSISSANLVHSEQRSLSRKPRRIRLQHIT